MDVYKIGVSIALANGVSSVLGVIQKDLLGLNKTVEMTNAGLNRMKLAVGGLAAVGVGIAMLHGINDLQKAGEKYTHQLELMKAAGMSVVEQQHAIAAADRVASQVMSTLPSENLQAIREMRAALNSAGASPQEATEEATKYLALVQKAQAVMQTSTNGRAWMENNGVFEMVKGLEEIGATRNEARFERLLGGMVQASEAFGGKVGPRDWFQTLKYTRGAGQFYDDDFITHYLPTLIQEMKSGSGVGAGGGPGAPLASLFQAVVGNTFSHKTRDLGIKLGLIDPTKSTLDRHGRIHNAPGAWFGADVAAKNPAKFIQEFLNPVLSHQMGGHMMDRTADGQYAHVKEMATTLASLFGNRTAQQMVGLLMQVQKMEGDKKLVEQALSLDQAYERLGRHDPNLVHKMFNEQLERIQESVGRTISPAFTEFLFNLTKGLRAIAEMVEQHPMVTQWIMSFMAGLAGLLVVLGTMAIAGAALSAIGGLGVAGAVAGIFALGGALAWLVMGDNWGKAADGIASFGSVLARGWNRILEGLPKGWDKFTSLMDRGFARILEGLPKGWDKFVALMERGWDRIVEGFPKGLAKLETLLGSVWDRILARLRGSAEAAQIAPAQPGTHAGTDGAIRRALDAWGAEMAHGWDVILEAFPRGLAKWGSVMVRGWDVILESFPRGLAKWGAVLARGWDQICEGLPKGVAKVGVLIGQGWDAIVERLAPLLANVRNAVVEGVRSMYAAVSDAVLSALGKISTAIMSWIDRIPALASQVGAALAQIGDAILGWAKSLPGKIMSAVPNGGPALPAQQNPFLFPGAYRPPAQNGGGQPHFQKAFYMPPPVNVEAPQTHVSVQLDGREIAANVSTRIVRSGSGPSGGSTGFDARTVYTGSMQAA